MSDNKTNVLLVTTDSRLRETVQRHQPPDVGLQCLASTDGADALPTSTAELWLDLDCTARPALPAGTRRVYFHTRNYRRTKDLPAGLFIRKPCTPTVAQVLWAGVRRSGPTPARPYRRRTSPGALPPWLLEFHELGLRELCRKCVSRLPARLGYADVSMYLHDPQESVLTLAETTYARPIDLTVCTRDDHTHLMAAVARTGKLLVTDQARRELESHGLSRAFEEQRPYADGACLIAPLVSGGQLWGLLNFNRREPSKTTGEVPHEAVFAFIGRALRHARAYDRARTEARVDNLTNLYNHRWIVETLTKEIRRTQRFGGPLSIILADLDELKAINDHAGHSAGDCVLRHVARRINSALRQFDSAARVGGDEFVILLPATDLEGAQRVAQRVIEAIRNDAPIHRNMPLPMHASLGVAQWLPNWDAHQFIDAADKAMYQAKRQGRDRLVCHPNNAAAKSFPTSASAQPTWPATGEHESDTRDGQPRAPRTARSRFQPLGGQRADERLSAAAQPD